MMNKEAPYGVLIIKNPGPDTTFEIRGMSGDSPEIETPDEAMKIFEDQKKEGALGGMLVWFDDVNQLACYDSRSDAKEAGIQFTFVPSRGDMNFLGESIITYRNPDGEEQMFGHLMLFKERGVYDAALGKVDVTPEEADIHNKTLDEALIRGLKGCKIGQGGFFYLNQKTDDGTPTITTFTGMLVSKRVKIEKGRVSFIRDGMKFSGRVPKDSIPGIDGNTFNFVRES